VTVRRATLADREALCLLYHQFRDFHVRGVLDRLTSLGDPPATFEGSELSQMLAGILASEDAALFVAVRGGDVVGFAKTSIRDDAPNPVRIARRYGISRASWRVPRRGGRAQAAPWLQWRRRGRASAAPSR
jgi:hypothetical protein